MWSVLVGGTHFGSHQTEIRAIDSAIGAVVIAMWLWKMQRRADRCDLLLLGALIAFLVACVASDFPRMSFPAATTAMGYTAAASLARWELSDRRSARAAITLLGLLSLGMLLVFLPTWGSVWTTWWQVVGTVPPPGLRLPVGPFTHFHSVAMLFALLLPALIQWTDRRVVRLVAFVGIAGSLLLIYGAGSRTVWVGVMLGITLPLVLSRGLSSFVARAVGIAVIGMVILGVLGVLNGLLNRLTTGATVGLRFEIWTAAFHRWLADPIFGTGPGSFSTAFTFTDYFQRYPNVGRHPDDAFVQLLMEAGVFGLVALVLVILAVWIGMRDSGSRWTVPSLMGMATFAVLSLTNDPASAGYYLIPVGITWAALSTPSPTPTVRHWEPSWRTALMAAAGLVIVAATTALLVASAAFDRAQVSIRAGSDRSTLDYLDTAVALDPQFGLYWRERGLAKADRDPASAVDDLETAIEVSPADTAAMRALALLKAKEGDADAIDVARAAADLRTTDTQNLISLAYVGSVVGDDAATDYGLVKLLQRAPWIAASPNWAAHFPTGARLHELLLRANDAWKTQADVTPDTAVIQVWLNAVAGEELSSVLARNGWDEQPFMRPLEAMLRCESMNIATIDIKEIALHQPEVGVILAKWSGDESSVEAALALAGARIRSLAEQQPMPSSVIWDPNEDNRIYERDTVVVTDLHLNLPAPDQGLSAWLMDPDAAARASAPGSPIASCDR